MIKVEVNETERNILIHSVIAYKILLENDIAKKDSTYLEHHLTEVKELLEKVKKV